MTQGDKYVRRNAAVISTLFAVLFLGMAVTLVLPEFPMWRELPTAERFRAVLMVAYAVSLVVSGLVYAIWTWRIIGLFHGALMLCLAGFAVYEVVFTPVRPQPDNPGAGILAATSVVVIVVLLVVGVVSAFCGIAVIYSTWPQPRRDDASG